MSNTLFSRRTVLETGAAQGTAGPEQAQNNGLHPQAGAFGPGAGANGRREEQGVIARAVARFFGPPPQRRLNGPRVLPVLGPNGEIPFPPNVFRGPGAAAAPGAVPALAQAQATQRPPALVFEYNYVWDPNTHAPVLMQPPMLQGFYREDGLWQAWPGGAEQPPVTPGPNAITPTGMQTPRPATADDMQSAARLAVPPRIDRPTATAPARPSPLSRNTSIHPSDGNAEKTGTNTPTNSALIGDSSAAAPTPVSRPMSARDAAAAAALQRFGPPSRPTPANPSLLQPPAPTQTISATGSTSIEAGLPQANASSSALGSATPKPTATSSFPPSSTGTALPTMIPLYDFGRPLSNQVRPLTRDAVASLSSFRIPGAPRTPGGLRPVVTPGSLWSLPERVTDEQLARLDTLTREAIDERLRILEDVSATANRCAEQLLCVRSMLPAAAAQLSQVHVTQPTPPPLSIDTPRKGKGVDPAERGGPRPTVEARSAMSEAGADASDVNAAVPGPNTTQPPELPHESQLAASVASQLAALASLTSNLAPSQTVHPDAVPLAVMDPALAEQVQEEVRQEPAIPNVGGQGAVQESGSDDSESSEDDV